jgi:hypothetical protein
MNPLIAAMVTIIIISVSMQQTVTSHSHLKSDQTKTLPCCETGVNAQFGIDCGFGVITGSGK